MKNINESFHGSWELVKWTAESEDGNIVLPLGADALGQITYDRDGRMAVQIMQNMRPTFQSEDPLQALPEEAVSAYNGFIAYCGNYEVNVDSHQVVHQIKISSFPNWVGQRQVRYYQFKEDQLILSTDPIGASKHTLVWKKTN